MEHNSFLNKDNPRLYDYYIKGKWKQKFLSSYLKETPKQYIEVD